MVPTKYLYVQTGQKGQLVHFLKYSTNEYIQAHKLLFLKYQWDFNKRISEFKRAFMNNMQNRLACLHLHPYLFKWTDSTDSVVTLYTTPAFTSVIANPHLLITLINRADLLIKATELIERLFRWILINPAVLVCT